MNFYKTAYRLIGIFVLTCGIILVPFLPILVNSNTKIPYLAGYFLLFIAQSASSYFFAYKQSILIASQKEYICSIVRQALIVVMNILQIVFLILTRQYAAYLIVSICTTIATNLIISIIVDKQYPYLKNNQLKLDKDERKNILSNVSSMMLHKVGNVIINSTDNILISSMIGIIYTGLYSNYLLIVNMIMQVVVIIFNAVSASVGDYNASKSNEESFELFEAMNTVSYWIFGMSSICMFTLFQHTISIWLGDGFLLDKACVTMIVINFLIAGIIRVPSTFVDVNGLYTKTRFKPILMAMLNLIISIFCAYYWGLVGIFIGTFASYVLVAIWVDPYFLYKYKFDIPFRKYMVKLGINIFLIVLIGIATYYISSFINNYILKVITCFLICNLLFVSAYHKTPGFQFVIYRLKILLKIQ